MLLLTRLVITVYVVFGQINDGQCDGADMWKIIENANKNVKIAKGGLSLLWLRMKGSS